MREDLPILLIEDSEADAQSIQHAFRKAQIRNPFIHFASGLDGLKFLFRNLRAESPPAAFLIVDLTLPDFSGFEILRWLRNHPRGRLLPVIILTDDLNASDGIAGESLGASAVHQKNLNFETLCGIIHKIGGYWLLRTPSAPDFRDGQPRPQLAREGKETPEPPAFI